MTLKAKTIKKRYKILWTFLAFLVLLALFIYGVLYSPAVQTWLGQRVSSYVKSRYGVHMTIGKIRITFFKNVELQNIYVEDLHGDTLLYAKHLEVDLDYYNLKKNQFNFSHLELQQARFRLVAKNHNSPLNLDEVLARFGTGDTVVDDSSTLHLETASLFLNNVHFSYAILSDTSHDYGINYQDIDLTGVHASIDDLVLLDDSVRGNIGYLRLKEKSGFQLDRLSGEALVSSTICDIKDLRIKTPRSDISGDYKMTYSTWRDYRKFISSVRLSATFKPSRVNSEDIAFFAPELLRYPVDVTLSGRVRGTIDNLKGKEIELKWLTATVFKGDIDITGLPDFNSSFINLKAQQVSSTAEDVQAILDLVSPQDRTVVPDNFYQLGRVDFTGSFTGFVNNFTAYGVFSSRAGIVKSDLSLKEAGTTFFYKGRLATEMFDLGVITGSEKVGRLTSNFTVEGRGFGKESLSADIDGTFKSFSFNSYNYTNVVLDGKIEHSKFSGMLTSKDPNANFEFNGVVDFKEAQPVMDFSAFIYSANLSALNLVNDSLNARLSANLELKARGIRLSEITGTVKATDIVYNQSGKEYKFSEIELIALNDPVRQVHLTSPVADVHIQGNFIPEEIGPSFQRLISDAVPSIQPAPGRRISKQAFDFSVRVKDLRPLKIFLGNELVVDTATTIAGFYNNINNTFELRIKSPQYAYKDYKGQGLQLLATKNNEVLSADILNASLLIGDSLRVENLDVLTKIVNDNIQLTLGWRNDDANWGKFEAVGLVKGNDRFDIELLPSEFSLRGERWTLQENARVEYDKDYLAIEHLRMTSGGQMLFADGRVSKQNKDKLNFTVNGFELASISFLLTTSFRIGGKVTGSGYIANPYQDLNFQADLTVDSLRFNSEVLGNLYFKGNWITADSSIRISSQLLASQGSMSMNGIYRPFNDRNTFDLKVNLSGFPVNMVNTLGLDEVTDFRGTVTGEVGITGSESAPILEGGVDMHNVSFRIVYLNTVYNVNDRIVVRPDYFGINRIKVTDEEGNYAYLTGTAFHRNFDRWNYDFNIDIYNFLCLNTNSTQNSLFYGTAYATGNVNIAGYETKVDIDVKARTDPNTRIAIPLSGAEEVYAQEFVRFINTGQQVEVEENTTLEGIGLNFDLEVTDDALVELIFDEKIGDKIRGRGNGSINMIITPLGEFKMYGGYEITQGDYLFTLRNVINKWFDIKKGGTIHWSGDPYSDTYIDITAEYRNVRAALYPIMLSDDERYKRREQVVCVMYLNGKLMEPNIRFDIQLPNADDFVRGQLAVVTNDENELNKQFLSLIIGRGFSPLQNGVKTAETSGSNAFGNNSLELVTNQLNNILSGISSDFNIGVNLRPGDEQYTGEYGVSLNTTILDQRLSLSTNVGVASRNVNSVANTSRFVGDFIADYRLSEDGRLRAKFFNQTVDYIYSTNTLSPYVQGVGVFYQEQFDTFAEFRRNFATLFERKKKKPEKPDPEAEKAREMNIKEKEEQIN